MSGVLGTVFDVAGGIANKAQGVVDGVFPPDKRERAASTLQVYAAKYPKIAAFLIANIALSGVPFLMFLVFSVSVFIFSLIATIFFAVLVTIFFTSLMVGVALLFLLPILFGTTFGASFLFFWGLVGYYILTWFNGGDSPVEEGTIVGDRFHRVTGGRLRYFTDGARKDANGNRTKTLEGEKDPNGMKSSNSLGDTVKLETY